MCGVSYSSHVFKEFDKVRVRIITVHVYNRRLILIAIAATIATVVLFRIQNCIVYFLKLIA